MTESPKFRVGIVGCGRISSVHIAALQELNDVEIVAVCDLNEKAAHDCASRFAVPFAFTDMEAMMQAVRPDVVHLLTPPQTHLDLARLGAKYRAHMYIEKPLASTEIEARAILEVAAAADVQICPGHCQIFEPNFVAACDRIAAGEIGKIVSVRVEQGFTYESSARGAVIPWSYAYDWGIFDNLMPHPLYLASYFLTNPEKPQVVGANLDRVREAGVEEIRALIPSRDAIGEVALSLTAGPEVNRLEVVGTQGRIVVDFNTLTVLSSRKNGLPSAVVRFTSNFRVASRLVLSALGVMFGIATKRVKRYMGLRALVAEFYRSLRTESAPPITAEEGLLNVQQMEQIKNSCRTLVKARTACDAKAPEKVSPSVLVTGASGFLGSRLVRKLSADGVMVRATTRLMSRATQLPGVEWIQCNLSSEAELRAALDGIGTIYHCAAMAGPPGSLEEYDEANLHGTLRLARLAGDVGVKDFIYLSSLSVYENPRGSNRYLDETLAYDARAADRGVYTQSKLGADRALLEYVGRHNGNYRGPRIIVLRPGSIYGPGAVLPVGRLQLPSTSRRPIIAGGRRVPMPLVYVDNLIDAMLAAAESKSPAGSVYNVVDSADVDQGMVAHALREVSGGRIKTAFFPHSLAWLMMLGIDLISLLRHRKLGTARFRLKRTLADMRFQCLAARKDLGWAPRVSLREGLARSLETSIEIPAPIARRKARNLTAVVGLAVMPVLQEFSIVFEALGFEFSDLLSMSALC